MIDRPTPIGAAGVAVPPWKHLFAPPEAIAAGVDIAEVLARLSDSSPGSLPEFDPLPITDSSRPPAEAQAIAAVQACPDLFLFDAAPGPSRTGVIASLAAELASSGSRVLLLAPSTMVDLIVNRLVERHGNVPMARALAPGEPVERLLSPSANRTAAVFGKAAVELAKPQLAGASAAVNAALAELADLPVHLESLRGTLNQLTEFGSAESAVKQERGEAATRAARVAEPLRLHHAETVQPLEDAVRTATGELDKQNAELGAIRTQLDDVTSEGKKRHGAIGFLKSLFARDDPASQVPELQRRLAEVETAVQSAASELARLTAERDAVTSQHQEELAGLLRTETARHESEADVKLAEISRKREEVTLQLRTPIAALAKLGFTLPEVPSLGDVNCIASEIVARHTALESERDAIARYEAAWDSPDFLAQTLNRVRIVVAPLAALGYDPLVPAPTDGPIFHRLLVVDADGLTESEFVSSARHAARWILMGDGTTPLHGGTQPRGGKLPLTTRTGFFSKLWNRMHRRNWIYEAGRLVVRLTDSPRTGLRAEPLADRPDVELRFADESNGDVVLAEVAFPPRFTTVEAKAFLIAELGEVRLAPFGAVRWHETADRLIACFPAAETGQRVVGWVDLASGVREKVTGSGSEVYTAAVQFEKSAGWNRNSAEAWLLGQIPESASASVRTAVVPRPAPSPIPDPAREMAGVAG